jgi:hypothetical protein
MEPERVPAEPAERLVRAGGHRQMDPVQCPSGDLGAHQRSEYVLAMDRFAVFCGYAAVAMTAGLILSLSRDA